MQIHMIICDEKIYINPLENRGSNEWKAYKK